MDSTRKCEVWLDETSLSPATDLIVFVLTPAMQICQSDESTERQRSRCLSSQINAFMRGPYVTANFKGK